MKMKKAIAMVLAVMLIVALSVAGTIAWLMDETDEVVNTFTVGDINIALTEENDSGFIIVPHGVQAKDPKVTVTANSEDCWVFVQVQENNNIAQAAADDVAEVKYVTWQKASDWSKLDSASSATVTVLYRQYTGDAEANWYVLAGEGDNANGVVKYPDTLTKAHLDAIDGEGSGDKTAPTLVFKAFAVQKEAGSDAAAAWALVPDSAKLK